MQLSILTETTSRLVNSSSSMCSVNTSLLPSGHSRRAGAGRGRVPGHPGPDGVRGGPEGRPGPAEGDKLQL